MAANLLELLEARRKLHGMDRAWRLSDGAGGARICAAFRHGRADHSLAAPATVQRRAVLRSGYNIRDAGAASRPAGGAARPLRRGKRVRLRRKPERATRDPVTA